MGDRVGMQRGKEQRGKEGKGKKGNKITSCNPKLPTVKDYLTLFACLERDIIGRYGEVDDCVVRRADHSRGWAAGNWV